MKRLDYTENRRCSKAGHDLTLPGFLGITTEGRYYCAECKRDRDREYKRKKAEQIRMFGRSRSAHYDESLIPEDMRYELSCRHCGKTFVRHKKSQRVMCSKQCSDDATKLRSETAIREREPSLSDVDAFLGAAVANECAMPWERVDPARSIVVRSKS